MALQNPPVIYTHPVYYYSMWICWHYQIVIIHSARTE